MVCFVQVLFRRVIHLTKSRWPNEYDRNLWTWPKNWQQHTLTFEHDQKYKSLFQSYSPDNVCRCQFFWSNFNRFEVILIQSSELASFSGIWFYTLYKFWKTTNSNWHHLLGWNLYENQNLKWNWDLTKKKWLLLAHGPQRNPKGLRAGPVVPLPAKVVPLRAKVVVICQQFPIWNLTGQGSSSTRVEWYHLKA